MKTLIVREAFGLDGKDYSRGDHITDPAVIEKVKVSHAHHVIQPASDVSAANPAKDTPK